MKTKEILNLTIFIFFILWVSFSCKSKNNKTEKENVSEELEVFDTLEFVIKPFNPAKVLPYVDNGKWGYADTLGEIVIPCEYDACSFFSDGLAWVKKNKKYGFIDSTGSLITELIYNDASDFVNGLGGLKKDNYWGLINTSGEVVIQFLYESIQSKADGFFHVVQNRQHGIIDKNGKQIILPIYDNEFEFVNNLAIVRRKGLSGVVNTEGKEIIECLHSDIVSSGNGTYIIKKYIDYNLYYYGLIDTTGIEIIPRTFNGLKSINNLALFAKNNKNLCGILSFKQDTIVDFIYKNMYVGNTNFVGAGNSKYGFISINGDTVIPFDYDLVEAFIDNFAIVKKANKFGVINSLNETVIPFEFSKIVNAGENIYKVYKDNNYGFCNSSGEMLTDCIYDDIDYYTDYLFYNNKNSEKFQNGCFVVGREGMRGAINNKGELVVPLKYHYVSDFDQNGLAIVCYKDLFGLINSDGKELTEIIYHEILKNETSGYYYALEEFLNKSENIYLKTYVAGYFDLNGNLFSANIVSNNLTTKDEIVQLIRTAYQDIVDNISDYTSENVEIDENTSAIMTGNKLVIKDKANSVTYEYYYNDGLDENGPFFILKSDVSQSNVTYDRYYFYKSNIVKWINNSGDEEFVTDVLYAPEFDEHYKARVYKAEFENALALENSEINKQVDNIDEMIIDIDAKIASGEYKKGDSDNSSYGEYYEYTDIYLDSDDNTIYYKYSTGDEGGSRSNIEYYDKGNLIYSEEESSYYDPTGNERSSIEDPWDNSWILIKSYFDQTSIIREYKTIDNDITYITNY